MAIKSYRISTSCRVPYVVATGMPHRPTEIKQRLFKEGEIIKGELKHANNLPAFVLVAGTLPVPVDCLKEVIEKPIIADKEIKSSADGEKIASKEEPKKESTLISKIQPKDSKAKYMDAILLGSLVGIAGVYVANKYNWLEVVERKHYAIGAVAGAVLGTYLVYRFSDNEKPSEKIIIKKPSSDED